jgi:hypothetical protein
MKKVIIGCLGLSLVLVVVGTGAAYYFIWRPASSYLQSFEELSAVAEMDEEVANQQPYAPPANGVLDAGQVDQLIQVQTHVRTTLGARLEELQTKYERLDEKLKGEGRDASITEVLGAWRDISGLLTEAKRAQVEALNEQNLSLQEYRWVRQQAFMAMGVPTMDFAAMMEAAQQGDFDAAKVQSLHPDSLRQAVPPENRTLVEPHAEKLQEMIALAWFGI